MLKGDGAEYVDLSITITTRSFWGSEWQPDDHEYNSKLKRNQPQVQASTSNSSKKVKGYGLRQVYEKDSNGELVYRRNLVWKGYNFEDEDWLEFCKV
jgi:hypothetical protein